MSSTALAPTRTGTTTRQKVGLGICILYCLTNIPTDLNGSARYRSRLAATVVARATTRALEEASRA